MDIITDRNKIQTDLVINKDNEPLTTVDNLKIAQLLRLILDNREIGDAVESVTQKLVLILGRFMPEQKTVLDTIKTNFVVKIIFQYCLILKNQGVEHLPKQSGYWQDFHALLLQIYRIQVVLLMS